jgi:hypothetical protein
MPAEHKSQGGLVTELLTEYDRDNEQYFYFVINGRYGDKARLSMIENLFTQLANLHQDDMSNVFHDSYTIFEQIVIVFASFFLPYERIIVQSCSWSLYLVAKSCWIRDSVLVAHNPIKYMNAENDVIRY